MALFSGSVVASTSDLGTKAFCIFFRRFMPCFYCPQYQNLHNIEERSLFLFFAYAVRSKYNSSIVRCISSQVINSEKELPGIFYQERVGEVAVQVTTVDPLPVDRTDLLETCLNQVEWSFNLYLQHENGNALVYDQVEYPRDIIIVECVCVVVVIALL